MQARVDDAGTGEAALLAVHARVGNGESGVLDATVLSHVVTRTFECEAVFERCAEGVDCVSVVARGE